MQLGVAAATLYTTNVGHADAEAAQALDRGMLYGCIAIYALGNLAFVSPCLRNRYLRPSVPRERRTKQRRAAPGSRPCPCSALVRS